MPSSLNVQYLHPDDLAAANPHKKAVDVIRGGALRELEEAGIDSDALLPDLTEQGSMTIVCSDAELPKTIAAVSKAVKRMVPRGVITDTRSVQRFDAGAGI